MFLEYLRHTSHDKYIFYVCVLLEHGFLNESVSRMKIDNTSLNMRGYWDLRAWWKLYQFATGKQIDLIRTYGLKAHIIGRIVGKAMGIPINITSVRNTDPWRKWYHVWLEVLTSGLTDLYISNSEAGRIATHRRERIPLKKIITIPNGIDITNYPSPKRETILTYRQRLGLSEGDPVLGIVANLRAQKGHKTIADALLRIQGVFPAVKCLFVGADLLNGAIHTYVQAKGLRNVVIFTGSREDIPELLSVLDVFLLPSTWEGFPKSILEAMAMQKPVVASNVGGIPEIVEHQKTGIIIPPQDSNALTEAVIELLHSPERASQMGQFGYQRVKEHFSIDSVVKHTEAVYDQFLSSI